MAARRARLDWQESPPPPRPWWGGAALLVVLSLSACLVLYLGLLLSMPAADAVLVAQALALLVGAELAGLGAVLLLVQHWRAFLGSVGFAAALLSILVFGSLVLGG